MAGRGKVPKEPSERRNPRSKPAYDWQTTQDAGWQHGDIPEPPPDLLEPSLKAWRTWLTAWFAAHWTSADLPGLRHLIRLYDQVERGEFARSSELRLGMDTYGITPKGQQDRRWKPPVEDEPKDSTEPADRESRYGHLRAAS
jgi:hypothetical protein